MNNFGLRFASSASRRTTAASRLAASQLGLRRIHAPRSLLYPVDGGLGDFLPPAALRSVGIDYQKGLLDRLNEEVRGTAEESQSIVDTVINTAPHKEKTLAFNYASLALNNSFFLDHLKPLPPPPETNHQSEISTSLASTIRSQHGSLPQLKSSFSAAAMGMFTSGWVWFVTDKNGNTGVLPTFGPGTLLIRSRSYMANSKGLILGEGLAQWDRGNPIRPDDPFYEPGSAKPQDASTAPMSGQAPAGVSPSSPTSGVSGSASPEPPNRVGTRLIHTSTRTSSDFDRMPTSVWGEEDVSQLSRTVPQGKVDMLNIGDVLYPLFCVSVHEHAWMSAGYGVWGKEEWLKNFWTVLDWKKVSASYEKALAGAI